MLWLLQVNLHLQSFCFHLSLLANTLQCADLSLHFKYSPSHGIVSDQ